MELGQFIAIDVETANPRYHSICQIGMVKFEGGCEVAADSVLLDPQEEFGEWQTRVHGIRPDHVVGAPSFTERYDWLRMWTDSATVVSHSGFDRAALARACDRYGLPHLTCNWVDSIVLAKIAWPNLKGFRLGEVAQMLGISFRAHDALEDARTCGIIAQHVLSGGFVPALDKAVMRQKSRSLWPASVRREGDGDGALLGQTIVFTGELSIDRAKAADMAAEAGGTVIPNVTKKTTMLIVGERDLQPGWPTKSTKHRRAEELIGQGIDIRIVGEADFLALAAITN